jgi:hypothetical protein
LYLGIKNNLKDPDDSKHREENFIYSLVPNPTETLDSLIQQQDKKSFLYSELIRYKRANYPKTEPTPEEQMKLARVLSFPAKNNFFRPDIKR